MSSFGAFDLIPSLHSKATVAEDMEAKALAGWFLADGSNVALPDLKPVATDGKRVFHRHGPGLGSVYGGEGGVVFRLDSTRPA